MLVYEPCPIFTRSEREIWSVSALLISVIKRMHRSKIATKSIQYEAVAKTKKKKKKKKKKKCPGTKLLQKASNMKPLQKKKMLQYSFIFVSVKMYYFDMLAFLTGP